MKKLLLIAVCLLFIAPAMFAQEHYTEGPIWRVSLVRVKPNHMDEYLTSLQQASKPFLEEEKRQGLILEYKFFLKENQKQPTGLGRLPGDSVQEPRCHGWPGRKS